MTHISSLTCAALGKVFAIAIVVNLLLSPSIAMVGDVEAKAAAIGLIAILEGDEKDKAEDAAMLFSKIPSSSELSPGAAYALALIQIREAKYPEAWTTLSLPKQTPNAIPKSLQLGIERLKLWLLLEAGATDKSEQQFKKLVTMSLDAELPSSDQTACCELIGATIGMLQIDKESSCIPVATLEKAEVVLGQRISNKNAKTKLEDEIRETNEWGKELSATVSEFESIGIKKAEEQNKSTQHEYEIAKQEKENLLGDLKSIGRDKESLEEQRRTQFKNRNYKLAEMKAETPGRPRVPVAPGPPPHEPNGKYKTNTRTNERKYEPPSDSEMRAYNDKMKKWRQNSADYEQESREYPEKKRQWDIRDAARRAELQSQLDSILAAINSTDKAIADLVAGIKQGVGKDIKDSDEKQDQLERKALISNIAVRHIALKNAKAKPLARPSNFQLLDYESECNWIRRVLF